MPRPSKNTHQLRSCRVADGDTQKGKWPNPAWAWGQSRWLSKRESFQREDVKFKTDDKERKGTMCTKGTEL